MFEQRQQLQKLEMNEFCFFCLLRAKTTQQGNYAFTKEITRWKKILETGGKNIFFLLDAQV